MKIIRIGVLGGIGPEATAEFYSKLIFRLQAEGLINSNEDFPQILINSIPAPELIYETISDSDLFPYIEGLDELNEMHVDFIVMVCNTIHLFYDKLQSVSKSPIVNLKYELKKHLVKNNIKSMLIIGTPSTINQGLYRFNEFTCFEPDKNEITKLSNAIFNFNRGFKKSDQKRIVADICNRYLNRGAERVVLGCTEFAVMLSDSKFPVINTIDVLVDATIAQFKQRS